MRKIYLVFTRDDNQWVNEMVDFVLVNVLPRFTGKGISTQITYFTGRTFEWYRFVDEMNELKHAVIGKPLDDVMFQPETHKSFLLKVREFRDILSIKIEVIPDGLALLGDIKARFIDVYPLYVLSLFIPGPWREDFQSVHSDENSKVVLDLLYKSRIESEGLLKDITNFLRRWLDPMLEARGLPPDSSKLLSVAEIEEFVRSGALTDAKILDMRRGGFVHMHETLTPLRDFNAFLQSKNIEIQADSNIDVASGRFIGSVAYAALPVRGVVKVVLNATEMKGFEEGMVLVTPMTAPEYMPIMKMAVAIVTNEGGVTCHAAIVSRELKKPCVIGTKIATKVLKDGDVVEVDAGRGVVKKL